VRQEERRTEYLLNNGDLVIEIRDKPCMDSMSGERFSVSVKITTVQRTLEGCGRMLQ